MPLQPYQNVSIRARNALSLFPFRRTQWDYVSHTTVSMTSRQSLKIIGRRFTNLRLRMSTTGANGSSKYMEKLRELHLRVNEARKSNHIQVVEEDKRSKLPSNWEVRQKRLQWEEEDELFRLECNQQKIDPDRMRALNVSAEIADRLEIRRRKKCNTDEGFSTYADASHRKYLKMTKQIKPDLIAYQKEKEKLGDLAFPTADTIGLTDRKDTPEAVERLAKQIIEQGVKRKAYSRRRPFDADADIDYINERNKRYNELLDRHYGKYTAEIKQNLERGTAI
ncbi:unnamed protein product [Schistosoma intercalatum]|nr:unnamed protein product [Schistosoma intercalatum]CAH8581196.1 unnamed protein product [Schistosoma intercalatum]